MADHQRFADLNYGQAGQLTYIPRDRPQEGPGELHTRRFTSDFPHFDIVGPPIELYPPSKISDPQTSTAPWQGRRQRDQWLQKYHTEAYMGTGSSFIHDLLKEEFRMVEKADEKPSNRPLLAVGPITDNTVESKPTSTQVLATVTGESREVLRLTRLQDSQWQWHKHRDARLNLSVTDPEDHEEVVEWASDGLAILQIKFATSLVPRANVRWLIVQKETSTVILHPLYQALPAPNDETASSFKSPSRIKPNPILTLTCRRTGGNAHSDVAFNPGSAGKPPQVIIVDVNGYWTVWNITGRWQKSKAKLKPILFNRGHVGKGWIRRIPRNRSVPAEKHGILLVGQTEGTGLRDEPSNGGGPYPVQSRHVLLWNGARLEVFDMDTGSSLPSLPNLVSSKERLDRILDIQLSPVNRDHVFILTSRYIFWVDVFCRLEDTGNPTKPNLLLVCPLSTSGQDDVRMTVCRASSDDCETAMVFISSPHENQLSTYRFALSTKGALPRWHRHIMALPTTEDGASSFDLHSLNIAPAELRTFRNASPGGPGSAYKQRGAQFFQANILGSRLSVWHCIFAAYTDPAIDLRLPKMRIGWTQTDKNKFWKKKRGQFLARMVDVFTLPHGVTERDLKAVVHPQRAVEAMPQPEETTSPRTPRPVRMQFERIYLALETSLSKSDIGASTRLSAAIIDAVRRTLEAGVAKGNLPFMNWQEAAEEAGVLFEPGESADAYADAMQSLLDMANEEVVVEQGRRNSLKEQPGQLDGLLFLERYLSELWLDPLAGNLPHELQQRRRAWVGEMARDLFMSTSGVMVQDVPLLGDADPEVWPNSQWSNFPSSASVRSSSQPRDITSSPPATPSMTAPDLTFQRLQLLAPSLQSGQLGNVKQASILSYWPTERGVDTKDYISSIAVASDRQFDDARERLRKREARRKAQAEKYKRPAFMRQGLQLDERRKNEEAETQPAHMFAMSSQVGPPSSQIQGPVTMSQPVAGVFGDRKKVKKAKKKSGFR